MGREETSSAPGGIQTHDLLVCTAAKLQPMPMKNLNLSIVMLVTLSLDYFYHYSE